MSNRQKIPSKKTHPSGRSCTINQKLNKRTLNASISDSVKQNRQASMGIEIPFHSRSSSDSPGRKLMNEEEYLFEEERSRLFSAPKHHTWNPRLGLGPWGFKTEKKIGKMQIHKNKSPFLKKMTLKKRL